MSTPNARRDALEKLCLIKLLQLGGRATAREIAASIGDGKPPEVIQPRLSNLAVAGLIRDTGGRVKGRRGRPQVVWEDAEDFEVASHATNDATGPSDPEQPAWFSKYGQ